LVRLPGIGTRYAMPLAPDDIDRSRFGLPAGVPLLLCPQSLFKIHPEDDARIARVLAAAPSAHLVMFRGRHPSLTAKFSTRLQSACAVVGVTIESRLHLLPQCAHDDYLRINGCCDAMLDTSRWSGGNTALDALACALPIATLPGRSMAMLRQIGIPELIARDDDDYVAIAARLATEPGWRRQMSDKIRNGRDALFDDAAPTTALAETLAALA